MTSFIRHRLYFLGEGFLGDFCFGKLFNRPDEVFPCHRTHMRFQLLLPAFAAILLAACATGTGSAIPETKSERQMLGLMEKFDRWDYNGNGLLNTKEIDDGITSLKGTSRAVKFTAAEVVEFYDRNGDKSVSLREAQAGYRNTTQNGAESL
jgi:hypothetical protein